MVHYIFRYNYLLLSRKIYIVVLFSNRHMKGYSTFNECIGEYKLLIAANSMRIERDRGESIASYLKKRVHSRIASASSKCKEQIKRNGLNEYDLYLISLYKLSRSFDRLSHFIESMSNNISTEEKVRRLLVSNAFKKGMLPRLKEHIPGIITSKSELIDFVRANDGLSMSVLKGACGNHCKKKVLQWMSEAADEKKILRHEGEWI